jgi:hypothetical protein
MSNHIIKGVIIAEKRKPNAKNFNRTSDTFITVRTDDGTRYYGKRPIEISKAEMGNKVELIATNMRLSDQIENYYFFSKTTHAEILE